MFLQIYRKLLNSYGPQGWWPTLIADADEKCVEIVFGTILTQNTSWNNVEKALGNLKAENLFDIKKISEIKKSALAELIKSAGYYNQKAETLRRFSKHVLKKDMSLKKMFKKSLVELRKELLKIKGIGEETADSIILYAAKKPIFVIDMYTKRLASRFGLCKQNIDYGKLQSMFMDGLISIKDPEQKTKVFNQYHALIVKHAKEHCKKKPLCSSCALLNDCVYKSKNTQSPY